MTKDLKHKIKVANFWNKNKQLKPLLIILLVEVMIILHQLGIITMVK